VFIDREAKRLRKTGQDSTVYGLNELKEGRFNLTDILRIWRRPLEMFLREPIVLCLSLLSGFSDPLVFVYTESFTLVFQQWGFDTFQCGLTFITIFIGYLLAYAIFLPDFARQRHIRNKQGGASRVPECRLLLLLFLAPLETIGLVAFA
jgi:hypothetical protein